MLFLIIGIILFVILILWIIVTYNNFITLGERVTNGKAQIATQIESRWDAVESLIHATKNYSQHEAKTLEDVTAQRISVSENSSIDEMEKGEAQLNSVLGRLMAISENYPDLKASEVYKSTMKSINKFEEHVRNARMIYNDVVTKFNRQIKVFPSNIIAKLFNFTEREYFQGSDSKQEMPTWD